MKKQQQEVFDYIKTRPCVTKKEIMHKFGHDTRKAAYILRVLVRENLIEVINNLTDARSKVYFLSGNRRILTIKNLR